MKKNLIKIHCKNMIYNAILSVLGHLKSGFFPPANHSGRPILLPHLITPLEKPPPDIFWLVQGPCI